MITYPYRENWDYINSSKFHSKDATNYFPYILFQTLFFSGHGFVSVLKKFCVLQNNKKRKQSEKSYFLQIC